MNEKAKCKNCTDKMIEEMAKVIDDRLIEANNYLGSMNKGTGYWIAQKLVEHYQPKIPEGSVVLSEGEYSDIIEDEVKTLKRDIAEYWACLDIDVVAQEFHKDGYRKLDDHAIITLRKAKGLEERTRKETAKEIAEELLNFINLCDNMELDTYEKISNKIDEIAKKYGVEVEE